ncbi:hypothetical protein K9M48_01730 [Candidatus Gracilibacteria bacterium]|nr:hypothetical protein [Candidatus Gracilibacteria bacterium]
MKLKTGIIFAFFLLFTYNFSFSQLENTLSKDEIQEQLNFKSQMENINQIKMFFCNDGLSNDKLEKQLFLDLNPGKSQDICLLFSNFGEKDVNLKVGFSHGEIDKQGLYVCDQDMGTGNNFSKIIYSAQTDNLNNIYFNLPQGKQKQFNITIKAPKDLTGRNLGCIGYMINGDVSRASGSVFDVILRKVATIDFSATGDIYQFGFLDNGKIYIQEHKKDILRAIIIILSLSLIKNLIPKNKSKRKSKK